MTINNRAVKEDDGAPQITAIAVMGVTGSGKSHFIRLLLGDGHKDSPEVGHDLASCRTSRSWIMLLLTKPQVRPRPGPIPA